MAQLSVNIDHIATIRQARYRGSTEYGEPDVVRIALEVECAGADGVTVHLREDRRHITDRDVTMLRETVRVKFNLEMAATDEMVGIAAKVRPHSAMLVPEGRNEVTTEGGLDVAGQLQRLKAIVSKLRESGCIVSAFVDADRAQIDAAHAAGFDVCEIHTGPYAAAFLAGGGDMLVPSVRNELRRVREAGAAVRGLGMRFNAGHALNYHNVSAIAALPDISELHIGHAIIARAVYSGIRTAVADMKTAMHVPYHVAAEQGP
jgi:pyridoxine 5-phosphate synthase